MSSLTWANNINYTEELSFESDGVLGRVGKQHRVFYIHHKSEHPAKNLVNQLCKQSQEF